MRTGRCPECGTQQKITQGDRWYKHGDCPAGGRELAAGGMLGGAAGSGHDPEQTSSGESGPDGRLTAVYLVRPGNRNEELRYSLRTLANAGIERVVIVGGRPRWCQPDEHIATRQGSRSGGKYVNVRRGFEAIADRGPDEFVLFNDDFFVMQAVDRFEHLSQGPLSEYLHNARPTGYYKRMIETRDALEGLGFHAAAVDAYTAHVPLPMTHTELAAALDAYDKVIGMATVVGALAGWTGTKTANVKNPPKRRWPTSTFLSTSEQTFNHRSIGRFIRRRFRGRSPWETR